MKLLDLAAALLIAASLASAAHGQSASAHRAYRANFQHVGETPSRSGYPRSSYRPVMETNCHPSRASLLMNTIQAAGADPFRQRAARAKITAIRNEMTVAERRETAKLFHIQANERKYLAQQALREQRIAERERDRESTRLASAR